MGTGELALIVSFLAMLAASISALYARRLALNDTERMKRKRLVFEPRLRPIEGSPGWQSVSLTVRNFEPVTAQITEIGTTSRRARLLRATGTSNKSVYPPIRTPPVLEGGARRIPFPVRIMPAGTRGVLGGEVKTAHLSFYVYGPCRPDQITVHWHWVDGAPT